MTRNDTERLAFITRQVLMALEDRPLARNGAKLLAIMIADSIVEQDSRIDPSAFLNMCGITHKLRVTRAIGSEPDRLAS